MNWISVSLFSSIKLVLFFFLINQSNASQDLVNLLEVKELQFNYYNFTRGDYRRRQILCTSFGYSCFYSPRDILCTNNDYKNYAKVNANRLSWTCKQNEWFSFISYVWFEDSIEIDCQEVKRLSSTYGLNRGRTGIYIINNSCSVQFILHLSIFYFILNICLFPIAIIFVYLVSNFYFIFITIYLLAIFIFQTGILLIGLIMLVSSRISLCCSNHKSVSQKCDDECDATKSVSEPLKV